MKLRYIPIFLLGFLSCAFLFYGFNYFYADSSMKFWNEVPFGTGLVSLTENNIAPSDWVSEDNILIFEDKMILNVPNITLSNYEDTGSMKPVFDNEANGIRIIPKEENDIKIGDIVSYKFGDMLIVHRVVEKGFDEKGIYFITQGDNNILKDEKIRFENIEYVTIGVIW